MAALAGLPWSRAAGGSRDSMLWDWFMRELDGADSRRREQLKAVRNASDLRALGERVRRRLGAAIGAFPERTPLNARHVGTLKRRGYVIEKIIFESRPRYYVTANLYRPDPIVSPRPAVIESCGHYREAKAQEDYQRACAGLATKGLVAMVFDPMGQGERLMYGAAGTGTSEHVAAGNPCYLVGRTLAHYRIWDAIRALDYLETRPDVDKTRLGMFGHSGGGMMTLLTAPLDPRLKAVMSCCAVTTFYHKTKVLLMADPEQIVPGVYAEGIDHPELIAAAAPSAFLIGAVQKDYVPLEGTRRTYDEVKAVFERTGAPDRVGKVETPGEHLLNRGLREACYGWMLKHLAGEPDDAREPDLPVETEQDLRCTATGRVMDLTGARSIFDLNREYARGLAAHRRPPDLRGLLALPNDLRLDPGIETPSQVTGSGRTLVVLIGPRRNPALAADFAKAGCAVMELDLRGWGETTPQMPGRGAKFSWEDFFAYRAIELGRPLAGMRVLDLVTNVEKARRDFARVFVVGIEAGGVIALHAAAVSNSISGVAAVASLASYQEVMEQPASREPVSTFVPAALSHYDLPQLAESIRPRPFVALKEPDAGRILAAFGK